MSDTQQRIDTLVKGNDVVLFMKGSASFPQCGFSGRAIQILEACGVKAATVKTVNVLEDAENSRRHQGIQQLADDPAALCQRRVHWRLGHHDGNVRKRRVAKDPGGHSYLRQRRKTSNHVPDTLRQALKTPNASLLPARRPDKLPCHASHCNGPAQETDPLFHGPDSGAG